MIAGRNPSADAPRPTTVYVATAYDAVWHEGFEALPDVVYDVHRVPTDDLTETLAAAPAGPPPVLVLDEALWRSLPAEEMPRAAPVVVLGPGDGEEDLDPGGTIAARAPVDGAYPEFVSTEPPLALRIRGALQRARLQQDRRHRGRELRAMEARFTALIERMGDGVVVVDQEGVVRFANPAAADLFRRPAGDLVGEPFGFPVVTGENTEIDLVRSDGETRVAELRAVETTWEGDEVHLITLRDTTERRRSEERARRLVREQAARAAAEEEARRASLLADASDLLFSSLDLDTSLVRLARFCLRHLGQYVTADVRRGPGPLRRVVALGPNSDSSPAPEEPETIPVDESPRSPQARVYRSGTSELVREMSSDWLATFAQGPEHREYLRGIQLRSAVLVPIDDREGRRGVLTVGTCGSAPALGPSDRTLLEELGKRAGLALHNARLYQEAAEGSRAKSDFLTIVSHELRTPLSAIMGYASLLREGIAGPLSADQDEYIERIVSSTTHLLDIITEILVFVETGTSYDDLLLGYEDLGEILDEVRTTIEPLARQEELELRIAPPTRDVMIYTDGTKVRKILLNLLTNAVKYTPVGSVTLEARVKPRSVQIRVIDTGIGIPPEEQEAIFQPFRQLENVRTREFGGLGLGLSIARRFTQLLGGRIEVESRRGKGTTFTVSLPRDSGSETPNGPDEGVTLDGAEEPEAGEVPEERERSVESDDDATTLRDDARG